MNRRAVCDIALTWCGTPYHHHAGVKGAGVDCAHFPLAVYSEAGLIEPFEPPHYSQDVMENRSDETYIQAVLAAGGREIDASLVGPGDLIVMRFGLSFSHGAIVLSDTQMIHALMRHGVVVDDRAEWAHRRSRFFTVMQ